MNEEGRTSDFVTREEIRIHMGEARSEVLKLAKELRKELREQYSHDGNRKRHDWDKGRGVYYQEYGVRVQGWNDVLEEVYSRLGLKHRPISSILNLGVANETNRY